MEHRYNRRSALMIDVVIYQDGVPIAVGVTRDLSRGGAYILSDKMSQLGHVPLELELDAHLPACPEHVRIHGEVVRSDRHGFGLLFKDADEEVVAAIQESGANTHITRSLQRQNA